MTISVVAEINSQRAQEGAREFNNALASMRTGVVQTSSSLGAFGLALRAIPYIAVIEATRRLATAATESADSFATLSARLSIIARDGTSASSLLSGIADAAERSRTPVGDLADIYKRNANALKDLGYTEAQGIRLAESLSKVTKVSGVSAAEASASMIQLSQALVSGKFQGDEFRSVAENMPEVLRIMEQQLGKNAKQLREMAEAGQLSGKVLAQSLLNAGAQIDEKFARVPKTASEAFAQMTGQLQLTFGEIAAQSGVSQRFAEIFDSIREGIKSPAFAEGARSVSSALATVGETMKSVGGFISEARVQWLAWTDTLSNVPVPTAVFDALNMLKGAWSAVVGAGSSAVSATKSAVDGLTGGLASQAQQVAANVRVLDQLRRTIAPGDKVSAADNPDKPGKIKLEESDFAKDLKRQIAAERTKAEIAKATAAGDGARAISLKDELETTQRITEEIKKKEPALGKQLAAQIAATNAAERELERVRAAREIENDRLENEQMRAEILGDKTVAKALEDELAVRRGVTAELRLQFPELARQKESEILITQELKRQKDERAKLVSFGEDFGRMLIDTFKSGAAAGDRFGQTLANIGVKLADMIVEFTVLKPLVASIGKSMGGFLSGVGVSNGSDPIGIGGVLSGLGSALRFADGGVFDRPVALAGAGGFRGVMAEAGPEAIMPLRRTSDGRLGVTLASGAGQSAPPNVTINVAGDATEATVAKLRAVAREELARATPGLVRASVSSVADNYKRSPSYLRR